MTYRLLVTGSRDWQDGLRIAYQFNVLRQWLTDHDRDPMDVVVVQGQARGADNISAALALMMGWQVEDHPADWNRQPDGSYDKTAGVRRNEVMVALGADACLAFIKDESPGATHCAGLAKAAGIPTRIVTPDTPTP